MALPAVQFSLLPILMQAGLHLSKVWGEGRLWGAWRSSHSLESPALEPSQVLDGGLLRETQLQLEVVWVPLLPESVLPAAGSWPYSDTEIKDVCVWDLLVFVEDKKGSPLHLGGWVVSLAALISLQTLPAAPSSCQLLL